MVVLLLFNDLAPGVSLTFEEIQEATMIPHAELARQIDHSCSSCEGSGIEQKIRATKQVKPGDRFFFQ